MHARTSKPRQAVRRDTKIAKAVTQMPGIWAPYDKLTHTTPRSWQDHDVDKDISIPAKYDQFYAYDWYDDTRDTTVTHILQMHSEVRLSSWHLNVLLALSCMSIEAPFKAHQKFGEIDPYYTACNLPLPTWVARDTVMPIEACADTQAFLEGRERQSVFGTSGCPDELNVECLLSGLSLSRLAQLVYKGERSAYDKDRMATLRSALSALGKTTISIYRMQTQKMMDKLKQPDFFIELEARAMANRHTVMNEFFDTLDQWDGRVNKIFSVKLIKNVKTEITTHRGVEDRNYDVILNPLLALSIAYGRSRGTKGTAEGTEPLDKLKRMTDVKRGADGKATDTSTLPTVYRSFVETFKHDIEVRRHIGVANERMLALYTLFESSVVLPFCRQLDIDELIAQIYGNDYGQRIGLESRNAGTRMTANQKMKAMRKRIRQDIGRLLALRVTRSDGSFGQVMTESQMEKVFGRAILR